MVLYQLLYQYIVASLAVHLIGRVCSAAAHRSGYLVFLPAAVAFGGYSVNLLGRYLFIGCGFSGFLLEGR